METITINELKAFEDNIVSNEYNLRILITNGYKLYDSKEKLLKNKYFYVDDDMDITALPNENVKECEDGHDGERIITFKNIEPAEEAKYDSSKGWTF